MKKINSEDRLRFALVAKSVLRLLEQTDSILTYQQFADAIGLKAETDPWEAWHRQQVTDVLDLLAAVEKKAGEALSQFHRVVTARTGKPGAGINHDTRLVLK